MPHRYHGLLHLSHGLCHLLILLFLFLTLDLLLFLGISLLSKGLIFVDYSTLGMGQIVLQTYLAQLLRILVCCSLNHLLDSRPPHTSLRHNLGDDFICAWFEFDFTIYTTSVPLVHWTYRADGLLGFGRLNEKV